MRGEDLGLAVVLAAAGGLGLVGFAIFPVGRSVGVVPALTAFGPAAVTAGGVVVAWGAALGVVLAAVARPLPAGELIFESDGGVVALGLALLPLAAGPLFLAGAADQLGRYGAGGVLAAAVCAAGGLGLEAAGAGLAWSRDEVRLGAGVITVIGGRGLPTITSWRVQDVALEVTAVNVVPRASFKVEAVKGGARRVVGRTSTKAEADALVAKIRGSGAP